MSGTTTTILAQLREAVAARVPGAEMTLIDAELRWVVSRFLTRTSILRESFSVPLVAGQASYVLEPTAATIPAAQGGMLSQVLSAKVSGLWDLTAGDLAGLPVATASTPRHYALQDARTLTVYPTPQAGTTDTLAVLAAVTLSPDRSIAFAMLPIPYVIQPWFDALKDGTLARLFGMPDKPWTSLRNMALADVGFQNGITQARNATIAGRTFGARTLRFQRFGR